MSLPTLSPIAQDPEALEELLGRAGAWWRSLPGVDPALARSLDAAAWREGTGWLARGDAGAVGAVRYEPLAWDTEVFRRPVGRVRLALPGDRGEDFVSAGRALLRAAVERARRAGVRHLSLRVAADQPAAVASAQAEGFRLFGAMSVLLLDCADRGAAGPPAGVIVRDARAEDHEELGELAAATSYPRSRFNLDPELSPAARRELYRRWALDGARDWAPWCLVAEHQGSLVGYDVWRRGPELGGSPPIRLIDHNLGGVAEPWRRRGVFAALARAGLARAAAAGFRYQTNVVNLENLASLRAHLRLGARPVGAHLDLHRSLS